MGKSSNHRFGLQLNKQKLDEINPWKNYVVLHRKLAETGINIKYKNFMNLVHDKIEWKLIYGVALAELLRVRVEDLFHVIEKDNQEPTKFSNKVETEAWEWEMSFHNHEIRRIKTTLHMRVRDTEQTRRLKAIYNNVCQVCCIPITISEGRNYSECHHMQPLGREHNGLDIIENMLVVCPNHHIMFDLGALAIHPKTKKLYCISGNSYREVHNSKLIFNHQISEVYLNYHWENIFLPNGKKNIQDVV
jgi:hypothetical protein